MMVAVRVMVWYPGAAITARLVMAWDTVVLTAKAANMTKGLNFLVQLLPPRKINVDSMDAVISNGTYFRVDLPLTIPVFNVQSIYQPYWWFILVSVIANLSLSLVLSRLKKK